MPELREFGIDVLGKVSWGSHFCLFYEAKQDLFDILVPFFKAGLENNEFCLWLISIPGLITAEEAKEALRRSIPNVDQYFSEKKIEILNSQEWYLEKNQFNGEKIIKTWHVKLKNALALGYDGMRASGDALWSSEKYLKVFFAYEKKLNYFAPNIPIIVLCLYPLDRIDAADVFEIMQDHQFALARRKGEWEVIETSVQMEAISEKKRLYEELRRDRISRHSVPLILKFLVTVISVAAALFIALLLDIHSVTAPVSLFFCALIFSGRYVGIKHGMLAVLLSLLAFKFYFIPPIHSLTIQINEIPRLLIFLVASLLVVFLSAAQRNKTESLRRAAKVLDETVQKLQKTNAMLQTEITDRKHAEDALRLAYQRLSYHFENTPLAVIEFDKNLFIKRWSKQAEEIFGWKESEALGKNVHAADFPFIYKDDMPAVDTINEQLTKGIVNNNFSLNRNYTKDGKVIYCEWYNSALRDEQGDVITILSLVHNVTERKKAEEELNQSYEEIKRLTEHLQIIREEERAHIAREIHDELGQQLTVLKMDVEGLNKKLTSANEAQKIKIRDILELLDVTAKSVRKISSKLRPNLLHNLGLVAAMEWHLKEFEKKSGINISFKIQKEELVMPDLLKNGLFRIFQESLTNISKHANATKVKVTLDQENQRLTLSIEDNGQGFEAKKIAVKETLGILGMRERSHIMGGKFEIKSMRGQGTTIIVTVPYIESFG